MGLFKVDLTVSNGEGGDSITLPATVDTGAFFSATPSSLLRGIGLTPKETVGFELADGRVIERGVCEAWTSIGERGGTSLVAFADDNVEPIIGAFTLERLFLMVDSAAQVLLPREFREIHHIS